jgi:two-component SAPR family response regulator
MNREVKAAAVAWLKGINRRSSEDKMTATKMLWKEHDIDTVKNTWDRALYKLQEALQPPRRLDNRNMVF